MILRCTFPDSPGRVTGGVDDRRILRGQRIHSVQRSSSAINQRWDGHGHAGRAHARAAHLALHAETMARLRKAQNDYEMYENNEMSYMPQVMDPVETVMQKRQRQREYMPLESDGNAMENPEVNFKRI